MALRSSHLILTLCCLLPALVATAKEPYVPKSDGVILERMPAGMFEAFNQLATLRSSFAADPTNPELASRLASEYLQLSTSSGDPRYVGYAQSAMKHWRQLGDAPPSILAVRAKIKERNHLYSEAATDLTRLLQTEPKNVQAWVELANIYRVQGKYESAASACDQLDEIAGSLSATIARAPLMAVTGQAREASEKLATIPPSLKSKSKSMYSWLLAMRSELARIQGDQETAEIHLASALAHNSHDKYSLRAYADLLLDTDRPEDVIRVTQPHLADNGILLRAAIAASRTENKELAARLERQLANRFDEIRLRGDAPHGRFEARFLLELKNDATAAVRIASQNWAKQKEPRDSRNLLEAALAAGNHAVAMPVLQFLRQHQSEDADLQSLVEQIEKLEDADQ